MRDYEFDQEMQQSQSEASQTVKTAADAKRSQLEQWSASAYGEVCTWPFKSSAAPTYAQCILTAYLADAEFPRTMRAYPVKRVQQKGLVAT